MTQQELEELATGEALSIADSSRLEGLVLDQERIRAKLLAGYRTIQAQRIAKITQTYLRRHHCGDWGIG